MFRKMYAMLENRQRRRKKRWLIGIAAVGILAVAIICKLFVIFLFHNLYDEKKTVSTGKKKQFYDEIKTEKNIKQSYQVVFDTTFTMIVIYPFSFFKKNVNVKAFTMYHDVIRRPGYELTHKK